MADIKVVIQLQDTVEDIIEQLGSSTEVNNASIQKTNGTFGSLSTQNDGINMKSWANVIKDSDGNVVSKVVNGETITTGLLSLADGYVGGANTKLIEQYGYNGYVFGAVPESKQLTVTLEVRGENIDSIIIYGDKNANQFPTKAYRDGDTNDIIYSDDATWAIKFNNVASSHTITLLEWNRANYNACITYVAELKNKLYLDKSWLKSVESLSQSTGQPKEIYYGVVSSRGNLEVLDRSGEIKDYIQDGVLNTENLPINIYCNNNNILYHISMDGEYLLENMSLSLPLTDKFVGLLDNQYNGKKLSSSTNAYSLIYDILSSMGYEEYIDIILGENVVVSNFDNVISHKIFTVKEYLSNITIPYPYLEKCTYREALNKFCVLAQLNIMKKDGVEVPIFVSARPIVFNKGNNIINVPKRMQFGEIAKDIIVKNKINSAICEYQKITYDFRQIGNRNVQIFDSPTSSYPIVYSTYYDKYKILDKDISIDENSQTSTSYNKDIEIVKSGIQDIWSAPSDSNLPIYRYSIVKFTINERPSIDLKELQFKVSASVNFIRFNEIKETTSNVTRGKFEWNDYTSSLFLDVKDSSFSDDEVISGWINPDNGCYAGDNLDMKVRVNDNSLDVFVALLESITSTTSNKILHSIYDSYILNISVKDIVVENSKVENSVDFIISSNELIQQNTVFNENPIRTLIENNILFDYAKGIKTSRITISCSNYYYINGEIAKDWNNGEIVEVGDIIKYEGDDTIWRVTGRNFRKVGVPMIDLELQEVRVVG